MTYSYNEIIKTAKSVQNKVKKEYKTGVWSWWSYYFAKSILNPKKDIKKISIKNAPNPTGTYMANQISKTKYLDMCKRYVKWIEKNKAMPNYATIDKYKITPHLMTEILSRILVYYDKNNKMPNSVNVNSKIFNKENESTNDVYNYFRTVFGSFGDTIDGALGKIAGNGYGYYYDDMYSNKQSIDRMKQGKGVNCTDSCHVFYNLMLALIEKKKYKKVECLHVKCQGGDGHVRLRITMNDGAKIYRDPASVLSNGNITGNWCLNGTLLAVNPSWFLENLNR